MSNFNVHGGHDAQGQGASGASANIQDIGWFHESVEDRHVKDYAIDFFKKEGHTTYDCTVNSAGSKNANLSQIVAKCNSHRVHRDISIHFNSARNDLVGDGSIGGVEVWLYDNSDPQLVKDAERICANIAKLGFKNRGVKYSKNLYVLRKTVSKAMIVECCFVDDKDDVVLYKKVGSKAIAKAIVEGILNKTISDGGSNITGSTFSNGGYDGRKARVVADNLNVRYDRWIDGVAEPKVVGALKKGDIVDLGYCLKGWVGIHGFKGNKGFGYVNSKYLQLI